MRKSCLSIIVAVGLSFTVQGLAYGQNNHAPGQHPAENVAHDEHVDIVHDAYVQFEDAVVALCTAMIDAYTHHTADHYDDDPIHNHDQDIFVADCVVQHHAAHNDTASGLHATVHNEHH